MIAVCGFQNVDGLIDDDLAKQNPQDSSQLNPSCGSGYNLHPNDVDNVPWHLETAKKITDTVWVRILLRDPHA